MVPYVVIRILRVTIQRPRDRALRDEGLLKLFFAGHLEPQAALEILRAKRAEHERTVRRFREEIEPIAASAERFGPLTVLRYGIGLHEFAIGWCDETIALIEAGRQEGAFGAGNQNDSGAPGAAGDGGASGAAGNGGASGAGRE